MKHHNVIFETTIQLVPLAVFFYFAIDGELGVVVYKLPLAYGEYGYSFIRLFYTFVFAAKAA
jgi:hypothetical protein